MSKFSNNDHILENDAEIIFAGEDDVTGRFGVFRNSQNGDVSEVLEWTDDLEEAIQMLKKYKPENRKEKL